MVEGASISSTYPLMKAIKARATTKMGKIEETSTTRDSAASRSRNSHMTQVKKAPPVGRRLMSQYDTIEKHSEMMTVSRSAP